MLAYGEQARAGSTSRPQPLELARGIPLSTTLGSAAEGRSLIAGCRSAYGT